MLATAILPVKSFARAKHRLANGLSADARRFLSEAMFTDVLLALRRAQAVERVVVVTADHGAQRIAAGYGAIVIGDEEQGHNHAARTGIHVASEQGAGRVLLVAGDCPLLGAGEVDALLRRPAGERSALIVPDRHGTGTNALLLTPPDSLEPQFGVGSCRRHRQGAAERGTAAEVVTVPSLALDVDTAADLEALQAELAGRRGGAAHTRGMLSQLMRSRS